MRVAIFGSVSRLLVFASVFAIPAFAHENAPLEPHDLSRAWVFDPLIVTPLLLSAGLYLSGQRRAFGLQPREQAAYWSGWFLLVVALVSPLHPLGEVLFSAHMVQHEILMLLAAPLIILGRPMVPYLWALPISSRRWLGIAARSSSVAATWSVVTHPLHATWIHGLALWIGHAPALFNATLENGAIHAGQHAMFLGSALLFWWSMLRRARGQVGLSVIYLFLTMMHSGLLGLLLVFSPSAWYEGYKTTTAAWGLSPLEDQQLGGLIMWVPSSFVFLFAGLAALYRWLTESGLPGNATAVQISTRG